MTLDDIMAEWEQDGIIDENHLDHSSVDTAKLHAKYLKILMTNKMKLVKLKSDYNILRKDKFRYYRGEMSRSELADRNWEPWQFAKPLKNEMDEFLKGDEDLSKTQARIEYIEMIVYAVESIMGQIKQRDWQIKNVLNWKTFIAGN